MLLTVVPFLLQARCRVVRYLKRNPGQGVLLHKDCDLQLSGWCDSDWAECPLTCRSLTWWFVLLGSSSISWKIKKQQTISRSCAEAEYQSMAVVTGELKWLKGLLHSLGISHSQPMWQSSNTSYCQEPNFSWAHQVHRSGLSLHLRRVSHWQYYTYLYSYTYTISWHFY